MLFSDETLQNGIQTYNRLLAETWSSKQSELEKRATKEVIALSVSEESIEAIEDLVLTFQHPPFMMAEHLNENRIRITILAPKEDGWGVSLRAKIIKKIFLIGRHHTLKIRIKRLSIRIAFEIGFDKQGMPHFLQSETKAHLGDLTIRSSNFVLNVLGTIFSPILEEVAENMACKALPEAIPTREDLDRLAGLRLADTEPSFTGSVPDLGALEPIANAISARIQVHHTPFGGVFDAVVKNNDPEGKSIDFVHYGDSAIWTGHYLAAESFRYAVTRDERAAQNAIKTLNAINGLIHLTDDPGLLSRVLVPEDSDVSASLRTETKGETRFFEGRWQGQTYPSLGHITRDQYAGVLLGTGLAIVLFDDKPDIRNQARDLALTMIDYLLERNFCPTEATPDPITNTKFTSVTYLGHPAQILAILQLAKYLDQEKYGQLFDQKRDIGAIAWFFNWIQTFDPVGSYYKFNLEHAMSLLLVHLESDPKQRMDLSASLRVQRNKLKFHANAWFNLIELACLGDQPVALSRSRESIERETRFLVAQALDRPVLMKAPPLFENPGIDVVQFRRLDAKPDDPGKMIARLPVPVPQRPGTDFIWQRPPFALDPTWPLPKGEHAWRPPGVDQILSYWFARWLGL